jgi:hypothetical protein
MTHQDETDTKPPPMWTHKDQYNAYRDLVKHEDALRNERLKTLFTIQGILFGALGFAWKDSALLYLVAPIAAFGLFVAFYYHHDLQNGVKAMEEISEEWRCLPTASSGAPRLIGRVDRAMKSPSWIVGGLALLWAFVCVAAIVHTFPKLCI